MAKDNLLIADPTLDSVSQVAPKVPPRKLSIPVIAHLILKGQSDADIARLYGVTRQAVNKYIHKNADDIHSLLDNKEIAAMQFRHLSQRLRNQVDSARLKKMSGKDLVLSAAICTDKAEMLSGNNQGDKLSFQVQVNIVNNQPQSSNINELNSQDNDRANIATEVQINKSTS